MTSQASLHIKATLGGNIARARKARQWTQRELAEALGVDSQAISRWERGEVLPGPTRLAALATHLEQSIAWLYTEHDEKAAA